MLNQLRKALPLILLPLAACSSSGGGGSSPAANGPEKKVTPVAQFTNARLPMGLAPTNDGAPISAERALLDQAIAEAKANNKSVILEISAAWCGPCTKFVKDMNDNPTNFQDLASKGYIFVKGEYEKSAETRSFDLSDYLPETVDSFPSFYILRPGQSWAPLGIVNTYAGLLDALAKSDELAKPLTLDEIKAQIEKTPSDNETTEEKTLTLRYYYSIDRMSKAYSYGDARAILKLMDDEKAAHPDVDPKYYKMQYLPDYVAAGAIDLPNLAIDFPEVVANLTDASRDDFSATMFGRKMAALIRSSGLKAGAAQCESVYQSVRANWVPGSLSPDDFAKKVSGADASVKVACADLIIRAGGTIAAAKQEIASVDPKSNSNWRLVEALGDTATALTLYQTQYKQYSDSYTQSLTDSNKALADATAANDQTKIKSANDDIAFTTFQQAHHAEVDAEVEKAISAGQYVNLLEREN